VAYAIHFYASSQGEWLRDKVRKVLDRGLAIFATEWGTCEASGNGALRLDEVRAWLGLFEYHVISDANWALATNWNHVPPFMKELQVQEIGSLQI